MSIASERARQKRQAKGYKVAKAPRRRMEQPRAGAAALALSGEDLENMRWSMDTARRLQVIYVDCPEVRAACPECRAQFVAKPKDRHMVRQDDLEQVAGFLDHLLGKLNQGATLHFAARG